MRFIFLGILCASIFLLSCTHHASPATSIEFHEYQYNNITYVSRMPINFSLYDENNCTYKIEAFKTPFRPLPEDLGVGFVTANGSIANSSDMPNGYPFEITPSLNNPVYIDAQPYYCNPNMTLGILDKTTFIYQKKHTHSLIKRVLICVKENRTPSSFLISFFEKEQMNRTLCSYEWIDNACCKDWWMPD